MTLNANIRKNYFKVEDDMTNLRAKLQRLKTLADNGGCTSGDIHGIIKLCQLQRLSLLLANSFIETPSLATAQKYGNAKREYAEYLKKYTEEK